MFRSNRVAIVGALFACVVLAGCAGSLVGDGGSDPEPAVDAAAIEEHAGSVDRYRIERTRTLRSEAVNETTEIEGAIDTELRRARLSMRTETDVGSGVRTTETEQYVDGDTRYTRDGDEWERTDGDWTAVETLSDAVGTLNGATFDPVRTETIDGTETTMFRVRLTDEQRAELAGATGNRHTGLEVRELVYYAFVDTGTDTLYGTDLRMEVTQGGGPAVITLETFFTDHNGDVDVSAPGSIDRAGE